ncbi:hypothetical protein [Gimesia sp.]|nr:hypothetical protein [Gimesia sp.]|tara:strand:+ start:286 stop:432 length:147 start_codon:yes stop_codon:yes gene_type:complete
MKDALYGLLFFYARRSVGASENVADFKRRMRTILGNRETAKRKIVFSG